MLRKWMLNSVGVLVGATLLAGTPEIAHAWLGQGNDPLTIPYKPGYGTGFSNYDCYVGGLFHGCTYRKVPGGNYIRSGTTNSNFHGHMGLYGNNTNSPMIPGQTNTPQPTQSVGSPATQPSVAAN